MVLLDLATVEAHDPAFAARNPASRRARLGRVARAWLNLGEADMARPLIREGLERLTVLPKIEQYDDQFLSTAARIEPDRVLSLIGNLSSAAERRSYYARIAESLAYEHPAEIEPNEHHRQYVWSHKGIDLDERRFYDSSYVCL